MDSTVYDKKDSLGRVIEKWGNYHFDDRNTNFRGFFYYNNNGLLIREKKYSFDDGNIECKIKDSSEYDEVFYEYKLDSLNNYLLEKEICYGRNYNLTGKYLGRKLFYIYDVINDKFIFRDDTMGDLNKKTQNR